MNGSFQTCSILKQKKGSLIWNIKEWQKIVFILFIFIFLSGCKSTGLHFETVKQSCLLIPASEESQLWLHSVSYKVTKFLVYTVFLTLFVGNIYQEFVSGAEGNRICCFEKVSKKVKSTSSQGWVSNKRYENTEVSVSFAHHFARIYSRFSRKTMYRWQQLSREKNYPIF